MRLHLIRTFSDDLGTFGQLMLSDDSKLLTGELPWRDNANDVSCIPEGVYQCAMAFSPHFKRDLYHVNGVPGREGVLIHPANFMGDRTKGLKCDLEGCIALGTMIGTRDGQKALLNSRVAIQVFEDFLKREPFELQISYL